MPPEKGAFYRGKSGGLRRIVKVRCWDHATTYDVLWAPAQHIGDRSGRPRALYTWCTTWEEWQPKRVDDEPQ